MDRLASTINKKILLKITIFLLFINTFFAFHSIEDSIAVNYSDNSQSINSDFSDETILTNCSILSTFNSNLVANPMDIEIGYFEHREILFISCGADGLFLFDITNIKIPNFIIQFDDGFFSEDLHEYIYSTTIDNNYCYVVTRHATLIYDFSDIRNPIKMSEIEHTYQYVRNIEIRDSLLFILDSYEGCYIYNIADIENPIFVTQISNNDNYYYDMVFYDNSENDKLIISAVDCFLEINYSTILDPVIKVAYFEYDLYAYHLEIFNNYLIATSYERFSIFNIDLEYSLVSRNIDTNGGFSHITVQDNVLYIVGNNRILIVDIAIPENIEILFELNVQGYFLDIVLLGDYILVLDDYSGVRIYSNHVPNSIEFLVNIPFQSSIGQILVSGNFAYCSNSKSGISVVNIRNPKIPKLVSNIECRYDSYSMFIEGNRLYLYTFTFYFGYNYKIVTYDISNPKNPLLIGVDDASIIFEGKEYTIYGTIFEIVGKKMYAICDYYENYNYKTEIAVIDLTNPNNLTIQEVSLKETRIRRIRINNDFLYLVSEDYRQLDIHSIDQTGSVCNDSIVMDFAFDIRNFVVAENYLYICFREKGLFIYDIRNLNSPIELDSFRDGLFETYIYYRDIFVTHDYLYLRNSGRDNIYVVDIRDKSNIFWEGKITDVPNMRSFYVSNNNIFLSTDEISMIIARLDSIPLPISISNQIFIGVGASIFLSTGIGALVFYIIRRPKIKSKNDTIELAVVEESPSVVAEIDEPLIEDIEIDIPETNDPELRKYLDQIFTEDN